MLLKTTNKLFNGKYQYKIVVVCAGAQLFRSSNFNELVDKLKTIKLENPQVPPRGKLASYNYGIKSQDDIDYAFQLYNKMSACKDNLVRVEGSWISVYSNSKSDIDKISKIDPDKVKYISSPPASGTLVENTVIMPKIDFEYRVTLGKTTKEHSAFVSWADANKKLKLTKSCAKELLKPRSWGGTYFYITGDNNLLMAKMHLGEAVNKVERIIKA
jgi:hypothetical protein